MKTLYRSIALLLIFIMITGCNVSSNDNDPQSEEYSEAEAIELEMWMIGNEQSQYMDLQNILRTYTDRNPRITINLKIFDWTQAWPKMMKAVTTGEGPDLLQLGSTWTASLASMGGLVNVEKQVQEIGGSEAYLPPSWASAKIQGDNAVYAVPWFVDARVIYYRKDAFEKAGVDPGKAFADWDSFKQALHQVNGVEIAGRELDAIAIPGTLDWDIVHNIFPWVWGAGGDVMSEDHQSFRFNSDEAVDGIMYYTGLVREGLVNVKTSKFDSRQVEDEFTDGKAAVVISGPWLASRMAASPELGGKANKPASKHYGIASLPAGPKSKATFIGGSHLAILQSSDHPKEAWDLIAYLSGDEAQLRFAESTGFLPARKSLFFDGLNGRSPHISLFSEAVSVGRTYPAIPEWGAVETSLLGYFTELWVLTEDQSAYNRAAVKELLDRAVKEADSIVHKSP